MEKYFYFNGIINQWNFNNDYEIVKIIGTGSYGKVYLGIDKQSKKAYPIKIQLKNLLMSQNKVE